MLMLSAIAVVMDHVLFSLLRKIWSSYPNIHKVWDDKFVNFVSLISKCENCMCLPATVEASNIYPSITWKLIVLIASVLNTCFFFAGRVVVHPIILLQKSWTSKGIALKLTSGQLAVYCMYTKYHLWIFLTDIGCPDWGFFVTFPVCWNKCQDSSSFEAATTAFQFIVVSLDAI